MLHMRYPFGCGRAGSGSRVTGAMSNDRLDRSATPGTVYLVGAGPGDPELLTVRGRTLLEEADAIVYDALVDISAYVDGRDTAELHFAGKRGGDESSARQKDINTLLVRLAREGKSVVRLKGGDPFVFGRGSEEVQVLAEAGIPFEVVPGVTAGVGAPAYAGIPVTHRGMAASVTFVTGREDPTRDDGHTDWAALARVGCGGGTIVLYMGVASLPEVVQLLVAGGMARNTPAAAIRWGTTGQQETVTATLEAIAERVREASLTSPVITVIGRTVGLRDEIRWFDRLDRFPLRGLRALVTRASSQPPTLSRRLRALGAEITEVPSTRIELADQGPLQKAVARLGDYSHLILTSQVGVRIFWDGLRSAGLDARALAGLTIAAVGPATADALLEHGITVDVVPDRFIAEAVLEVLRTRGNLAGARVLYPAAEGARTVLLDGLREMGATVDFIPTYRSVHENAGAEALRAMVVGGSLDLGVFASGAAVRGFVESVGGQVASRLPAITIGPITSESARTAGLSVIGEATDSTIEGLVDEVLRVGQRMAGRKAMATESTITAAHDGSFESTVAADSTGQL
jgi:uroporphyrinogen III methyltransferase/synthase